MLIYKIHLHIDKNIVFSYLPMWTFNFISLFSISYHLSYMISVPSKNALN